VTVQDVAEQLDQLSGKLGRSALLDHRGFILLSGDRQVAHGTAGCAGDLGDGVGEPQQSGAGHLVDVVYVPLLRQGGDRDVGDVVGVGERLGHVAGGERDHTGAHRIG